MFCLKITLFLQSLLDGWNEEGEIKNANQTSVQFLSASLAGRIRYHLLGIMLLEEKSTKRQLRALLQRILTQAGMIAVL